MVVSGYVLPCLQVKYGVGIFDSIATLTLRYRLMPKLYLEAVSGVDRALDLLLSVRVLAMRIFVYGSLRHKQGNSHWMTNAQLLGDFSIDNYQLYSPPLSVRSSGERNSTW